MSYYRSSRSSCIENCDEMFNQARNLPSFGKDIDIFTNTFRAPPAASAFSNFAATSGPRSRSFLKSEVASINGVPTLPHHMRVTVDKIRDPQAQVPIPTPEINFVGKAIGSFIAWPRALIMSHIATPQFTRPQQQPIHDTVIHVDDDMAEAKDDPLSKLMTRLPRYMDTIVVDQGWSSMYGFVEPQTIQPSVIGKSRGQLVQILYPKVCNQQLHSWECGFYVMCWIKTIIRAVITDDWNERFKSTSPIPEGTIRQIR
ncbi:hypothetical protein LR48_Vigan11g031200 [Vigna angularis]|uniref:DUF8039 domain-containing protein n=1 Tax=Phaseolus angularis TaxID=3914 RepID=A0A0L9VQD7_PHAAN|nr:hypothetical protein LR48_Vigan11g031200 [Vigna angularis]